MKYLKIDKEDVANGNGIRVVLWVSGCNHKCKGCHNMESWNPDNGVDFSMKDTMQEILDALLPDHIKGLTITGGDPLFPDNRDTVISIIKVVKAVYPQKDIWIWTGYKFEEVYDLVKEYVDILIDGKFIIEERDVTLKWRGSPNQRIIDVKQSTKENIVEIK